MDKDKLKYVVGTAQKDAPAIIRFFGYVNSESAERFKDEFLWLQDCVRPSKIIVSINSEGGSVIYGMSVFSIIKDCPIEVDCVIEGIAASMGSVIWAAGKNQYMHDYSILMIHNPFVYDKDSDNESIKDMINAFRKQLETIYRKRFGLSKDRVREIMDGKGEADGTYLDAEQAVAEGFLPSDNVIKTSKKTVQKVKNQINGVASAESLRDVMALAINELGDEQHFKSMLAIHNKEEQNSKEGKEMENKENPTLGIVLAQLGLKTDEQPSAVSARVSALLETEKKLQTVQSELDELKIKFKGKETEVDNAVKELKEAKDALQVYKDAEAKAKEEQIEKMVQDAVDAGKIQASAKADWVAMAKSNMETVKATLDSIQAREVISAAIAEETAKDKPEAELTEEEKLAKKVEAVVGKDFKFNDFK